jgi:hypothetical protein
MTIPWGAIAQAAASAMASQGSKGSGSIGRGQEDDLLNEMQKRKSDQNKTGAALEAAMTNPNRK